MSQRIVYEILEALGGKATFKEIKEMAKAKYPSATLHTYVGQRLRGLKAWGYIAEIRNKGDKESLWVIKEKFPSL